MGAFNAGLYKKRRDTVKIGPWGKSSILAIALDAVVLQGPGTLLNRYGEGHKHPLSGKKKLQNMFIVHNLSFSASNNYIIESLWNHLEGKSA